MSGHVVAHPIRSLGGVISMYPPLCTKGVIKILTEGHTSCLSLNQIFANPKLIHTRKKNESDSDSVAT